MKQFTKYLFSLLRSNRLVSVNLLVKVINIYLKVHVPTNYIQSNIPYLCTVITCNSCVTP